MVFRKKKQETPEELPDLSDEEEQEQRKPQQQEEYEELWEIGEVATQTAPVLVNKETKEQLTIEQGILRILNDLDELKQLL